MSSKFCKKCGNKIPRKYKTKQGTLRKTSKKRNLCYNCSPMRFHSSNGYGSERRKRKHILVGMKGGKCKQCGYNKSVTALSFHHRNPSNKSFDMSNGGLMQDWQLVLEEVKKCDLLCLNCHAELHNGG